MSLQGLPNPNFPTDIPDIIDHIEASLKVFFDENRLHIERIGDPAMNAVSFLEDFVLTGGKRIRPLFAWAGFLAGGGFEKNPEYSHTALFTAISSLELVQACALIHDDFIDSSDTRRGQPTVHRRAETLHRSHNWQRNAKHFGASVSILVGDLALVWADDMFYGSGLPAQALIRAFDSWRGMRTEVIGGQLLDIANEAEATDSLARAYQVNLFKTAAYTIERPVHLGAALAGAEEKEIAALRAFGRDIGVAFQLRDDLLGVFGDPTVTGKPAGDDLREGKRTVLIAQSILNATNAGCPELAEKIKNQVGKVSTPEEIAELSYLIESTGVVGDIEKRINDLADSGLAHLRNIDLPTPAQNILSALANKALARTS
ncbi:geranylgeranyl pyrophosphate synthase [Corynebacterium kutscheri]|uniref:Geranylgeranyl pyrophosphate synthase n=1 Tax=Corynebacterium kutscheri TaxID=35755 RepID=A0A0F6R2D0_9CORY|nr:geranylgeranyl pyrophosphate synthase [Corynebacterium kutscheri]VEH09897.1 geranylgeranyl pyrophosphate synthase [Corynebacterium kutscheri]